MHINKLSIEKIFSGSDWLLKVLSRIDSMINTHTHTTNSKTKIKLKLNRDQHSIFFYFYKKRKMHTNPVVSCSLFVERWDKYQQGSLISRKLIYLAKSYSASFLIFPAFHGNQTKLKKFVINASTFSQKPQNASSFWTFWSYISNSDQNKTKSNPIRNLLRLPIQTNQKKKEIYLGFALVAWRFIVRLACRILR